MATLGATLTLRLTLSAVSFLMYCVISLCELIFSRSYCLWAVEACLREGSSLPLLGSIEFKPVCTLIFPIVVSTLGKFSEFGPHICAWILILCRLSFLYPNCCPAAMPAGRWGLFSPSEHPLKCSVGFHFCPQPLMKLWSSYLPPLGC